MDENNTFGTRLKNLRNKAGVTQEEIAQKLGIAKANISRYESGKQKPEFNHMLKMAEYLKVHPTELLLDFPAPAGLANAQAFMHRVQNPKNQDFKLSIPDLLAQILDHVLKLPIAKRREASEVVATLFLAPDSPGLKAELTLMLAGDVPIESSDFVAPPPRKKARVKGKEQSKVDS